VNEHRKPSHSRRACRSLRYAELRGLVIAAPQPSDGLALSLIGYRAGPIVRVGLRARFAVGRRVPGALPTGFASVALAST
jgi:hypothetical protein